MLTKNGIERISLDAVSEDDVLYNEDVLGKLIEAELFEEVRRH